MKGYTLERVWQIWNDQEGECIEIGPDRDGLDLIEVRYRDSEGKIGQAVTFNNEQFVLLIDVLQEIKEKWMERDEESTRDD